MTTRVRPEGSPPASESTEQPQQAPPQAPQRTGPDGFESTGGARRNNRFVIDARPPPAPPRGRILDPRLIPVVPAAVTTDPSRQFHALLGLPPQLKNKPPPPPPPAANVMDLDAILKGVPAARAKLIKSTLTGPDHPGRKRLQALLSSPEFAELDEAERKGALMTVDLKSK